MSWLRKCYKSKGLTFYPLLFALLSLASGGKELFAAEHSASSPRKAFFLSLLVPGAGELYAGDIRAAKSFLRAEALIWTAHLGFKEYGRWRRVDYLDFAKIHAGIDPKGKNDRFFDDIKFYNSSYRYNELAFQEDGPEARLYPPHSWEWDSQSSRLRYRSLRNSSLLSYRYASYMIAAAVINRIVSAIDAVRIVHKLSKEVREADSQHFQLCYFPSSRTFILLIWRW